jgi:large subunit ribosomal protein L31
MKDKIHPKTYNNCVVTCACGNSFETISTQQSINVEICSMCHPFYTGQQKYVDTEGRIDKFKKKQVVSERLKKQKEDSKNIKKAKTASKIESKNSSLKELLEQARKDQSL